MVVGAPGAGEEGQVGVNEEGAGYTVTSTDRHGVAYAADGGDGSVAGALPAEPRSKQQAYVISTNSNGEDIAPTLDQTLGSPSCTGAQSDKRGGHVVIRQFDMQAIGQYGNGEVASTIKQRDAKGYTDLVVLAYGVIAETANIFPVPFCHECSQTLAVHHSAAAVCFKAGQSKDGGLGDELEVSPTLSHQMSALEPTVALLSPLLSAMHYIVRRLTPTECERLMGLPDGYTIPVGLDPNDPALVAEFQRIQDSFNAITHEYALASYERGHREGEPPPKLPKPKTAAQVQKWLAKITNPQTCPDSPRYKACGNGWATNQPRWIIMRIIEDLKSAT